MNPKKLPKSDPKKLPAAKMASRRIFSSRLQQLCQGRAFHLADFSIPATSACTICWR
jgi:hypothetical protein